MGRMGLRLIQLIAEDPRVELVAAIDQTRSGEDAGVAAGVRPLGVAVKALKDLDPTDRPDVVIDFSHPSAVAAIADYCRREKVALVVGTTGLEAPQQTILDEASATIPVLASPNMSRAVNLLMKLVGEAAAAMGPSADVEIVERHHRLKKDSPSGTALRLAEIVTAGSGADRLVHGREGQVGERTRGEIGCTPSAPATAPASTRSSSPSAETASN
jgi:4-hydroxy-tetrahydrodipicolinate reductase